MILPVIGILAFTGCSSIDGTAERQQATTKRVAPIWNRNKSNSSQQIRIRIQGTSS